MSSQQIGLIRHGDAGLQPDPARVIARLFLPGEDPPLGRSRAGKVVQRVLALAEDEVELLAAELIENFSGRHHDYRSVLAEHAAAVGSHLAGAALSDARWLLIGATFTAEYSIESAALCNPSAVLAPDQSGLAPGQVRVAISLRSIGEGHLSSVSFATARISPDRRWDFEPRTLPVAVGANEQARWQRDHLRAVLADQGPLDELTHGVLAALPEAFTELDLNSVLGQAHPDLLSRSGVTGTVELLHRLVGSAYQIRFPAELPLCQRVLLPSAAEESNGMEDARFVRFVGADGATDYRATYTAYDGQRIAPRVLISPDLRVFRGHRLAGPAARNKGMALFPRLVGGRHLALCRTDGETISLASSGDGLIWGTPELVQAPGAGWELLQIGNCGPPIETDQGWLVLTHGVGPMRTYSIGAILLDLHNPATVLGRLEYPLLRPADDDRDGYVPGVVYSCGGLVHEGVLWLPYGINDCRIGVASVPVEELLAAMAPAQIRR
jgi:predicted GH43/DUF377 family glycosyl hydrolase